ncbi:MAG: hypothetical protein WC413_02050 [Candidatus Nanoarchaeia archaeon]
MDIVTIEDIKKKMENSTCKDCKFFELEIRNGLLDKDRKIGTCKAGRKFGVILPEYRCQYLVLNNEIIDDIRKEKEKLFGNSLKDL